MTLQAVGWLPGRLLSLTVTLERSTEDQTRAKSMAWLIVGSLHDDKLLVGERISLQAFPSPYVINTSTRSPSTGLPLFYVHFDPKTSRAELCVQPAAAVYSTGCDPALASCT